MIYASKIVNMLISRHKSQKILNKVLSHIDSLSHRFSNKRICQINLRFYIFKRMIKDRNKSASKLISYLKIAVNDIVSPSFYHGHFRLIIFGITVLINLFCTRRSTGWMVRNTKVAIGHSIKYKIVNFWHYP